MPKYIIMLFVALVIVGQNGRAQWTKTSGPYVYDIGTVITNGNDLFAIAVTDTSGESGLFHSSDNGESWNRLLDTMNVVSLTISGTNLYAIAKDLYWDLTLLRTTNSGISWSKVARLPAGSWQFVVKESNVFAANDLGVYRTNDVEGNWTQVNSGLEYVHSIVQLVVSGPDLLAATDAGVYRTTNDGANWTELNSAWRSTSVSALIASGSDLFAGTIGGGVYHSTDNGRRWRAVNSGLSDKRIGHLAMSGTHLYAMTPDAVYLTTNRGVSWASISSGLPDPPSSFVVMGENIFVVNRQRGLYHSTNNGRTWTPVRAIGTYSAYTAYTQVLAATQSGALAGGHLDGMYRTTNDGANWIPAISGLRNRWVNDIVVSGALVFAATKGGVYRSTDNGLTWSECNSSWRDTEVEAVDVCGTDLFAATSGGGVFRSTDNGAKWRPVNSGLENAQLPFEALDLAVSGTNVFALVGEDVFVTTNRGASWGRIGWTDEHYIRTIGATGSNLFAGASQGIFVSTYNGVRWTEFQLKWAMPGNQFGGLGVRKFAFNGSSVFAAALQDDGGHIMCSTDNGSSWASVDSGLPRYYSSELDTIGHAVPVLTIETNGEQLLASIGSEGIWIRPLSEMVSPSTSPSHQEATRFRLDNNYPNPFNPATTIRFSLPAQSFVRLNVYDMLGRHVIELVNGEMEAGVYQKQWNASVASGLYFYRLEAVAVGVPSMRFVDVRRMILVK